MHVIAFHGSSMATAVPLTAPAALGRTPRGPARPSAALLRSGPPVYLAQGIEYDAPIRGRGPRQTLAGDEMAYRA